MIGGVGLNEGVLPTKPPSALPMHMNNHVLELHDVTCAPVRLKTWVFFQIKVYSLILQEIWKPYLSSNSKIACYKKARTIYKKFSTDGTDIYVHVDI